MNFALLFENHFKAMHQFFGKGFKKIKGNHNQHHEMTSKVKH
jgi:hypothetical protein